MRMSGEEDTDLAWRVVDAETGGEIPDVTWADDEAGEYLQLVKDESGNYVEGGLGFLKTERKRGNIRFVRMDEDAG